MLVNKILAIFPNRKNKQVALHNAYKRLFETEDGILVLADLVEQAGLAQVCEVRGRDGSISSTDTFVEIGKRNLVLGILRRIHKNPTKLINEIAKEIEAYDEKL